jgi:hypothetical protein
VRRWYEAFRKEEFAIHSEKRTLKEKRRSQMDWEAEVIARLTPWQIATGLSAFSPVFLPRTDLDRIKVESHKGASSDPGLPGENDYPFRLAARNLLRHINTSRFYANLDAPAREKLLDGTLTFQSLLLQQKAQVLYVLPRLKARLLHGLNQPIYLRLIPKSGADMHRKSVGVRLQFSTTQPTE